MAARRWTAAQRKAQAQKIRKWKPWTSSTGPKTDSGKAIASQNALKHGERTAQAQTEAKEVNAIANQALALIKKLEAWQ